MQCNKYNMYVDMLSSASRKMWLKTPSGKSTHFKMVRRSQADQSAEPHFDLDRKPDSDRVRSRQATRDPTATAVRIHTKQQAT
eukprot:118237-Amphidinium_carterae.1